MYKALYSTRSGGACWHDKPFDILQQTHFLKPQLFWKEDTCELTVKTKGSGGNSPNMGLSPSIFDKNSTPTWRWVCSYP